MDAYDISDKIKKYWAALYPKDSGELTKNKMPIKVCVHTNEGYKEVKGVKINNLGFVEIELDDK